MRYLVMYESKSGNTRKLAERIYQSLDAKEKDIIDLSVVQKVPKADVYFVGFGINNGSCSRNMMDYFEQIEYGSLALFATCGYLPTDQYKSKLEKNMDVWLPEDADYLGMFLCQGSVEPEVRRIMIERIPERKNELNQMFQEGTGHPSEDDLEKAADFAVNIQNDVENSAGIHIF